MPTENNPAMIYLAPACNENSGDGRDWCADDVFETCECGSEPVRYVIGSDFDRVAAEREALQQRLTAQDQRVDELEGLLREVLHYDHCQRTGAGFNLGGLLQRIHTALITKPTCCGSCQAGCTIGAKR
ncbi:hypothetical protein C4K14_3742 [Pseudomonas chlororaphis subsp. aureofaciens]|uniref:hypothetical protein n=1 Tax=Pseudomonas chlororaphis TaxID=587753 RepID=UPI000F589C8E|nr:hypothetical protein [Pseudomonas chlororaphis]AZD86566.1 hypothetical protein C4K14_3742 [Pseudomonas chlororaphis subsp. aureofaciens]